MSPLSYDEEKVKQRLPFIFIGVWVIAFLLTLVDYTDSYITDGVCMTHIYDLKIKGTSLAVFWFFTFLLIPSVIMIYCYIRMFYALNQVSGRSKNSDDGIRELSTSSKRMETMKSVQRNVIYTCAILSLFFISTYSFLFITDTLVVFELLGFGHNIWNAAFSTLIINSCVNPFVYTIR